ncbi:MAG: hypothetical protein A3I89_03075 [Candidatus Harrisonbacteria bacterium RIFCSPLOWO2_02_FULL_41_11]|uniref:Uncharacterized protein n=1 Tax=Candidatus Harrisonbacteria bacterium RIFCSPHIGHO2_02_FULL_42_16 TaxID=1798404 RepID=A0A1G1ZIG4_9BACT|nr:MAG: hypothetical protein A3B92_02525 [Candidatus Harrisonbacteria bacterium RIFCSPHIGHO2_02_FULL_42_16]OGY67385.1 MAG: hypothetical protein A3I89_03075 [Candidatus Harrisonbacteria bacterium RIFCSPLOWO2_02_FULL_41_11]
MIKLFFQQRKTKFIEISPETDKRLKLYYYKRGLSAQRMAEMIQNEFGDVSEELIVRYLNLAQTKQFLNRLKTVMEVVTETGLITEKYIPKFLISKNNQLSGKSTIEALWEDDKKGYKKVMALIESIKSGSFP